MLAASVAPGKCPLASARHAADFSVGAPSQQRHLSSASNIREVFFLLSAPQPDDAYLSAPSHDETGFQCNEVNAHHFQTAEAGESNHDACHTNQLPIHLPAGNVSSPELIGASDQEDLNTDNDSLIISVDYLQSSDVLDVELTTCSPASTSSPSLSSSSSLHPTSQNCSIVDAPKHGFITENDCTLVACVRPKFGSNIIGVRAKAISGIAPEQTCHANKNAKRPPKKKKWRSVNAEDMGFRLSLFPRVPVTTAATDTELEERVQLALEAELEAEAELERLRPLGALLRLEGAGLSREDKRWRKDRHRREQRARRQVRSKNVRSVMNNPGRQTLYVHVRVYKRNPFLHPCNLAHPNLPSPAPRPLVCLDVAKAAARAQYRGNASATTRRRNPQAQSLRHALDTNNAANELPMDMVSLLISLQHRDLTPEDYDMLLRLDDSVKPKTIQEDVISSFKKDVVDDSSAGGICSVCIELYETGQKRTFLPCGHVFHAHCIEMWLKNSSMNCPLDGLPVAPS